MYLAQGWLSGDWGSKASPEPPVLCGRAGSPSFLGFSWKHHYVGVVRPLEGVVGASRGQTRQLQPPKPWKRRGSLGSCPWKETLLCLQQKGVNPQSEPPLPSR